MDNSKFEKTINRIFEILPGLLIWILLLSPIWAGLSIPLIMVNLLVVLSLYWLYRALITSIGTFLGYLRYKKDIKKNWINEIKSLDTTKLKDIEELPNGLLPKYLIVIAHYGETYDILKRTIDAIVNQNYPIELIYICISIEERKAQKDLEYANRYNDLKRDFGEILGDRLMFTVHPFNIPGEVIGASSNRAWGAKYAVTELERRGEDISKFLVTAPDGDLVFHKEYLAASSFKWITSNKRNKKFYQTALYTFNNNYWDVPLLIRNLSISLTLPVLASSIMERSKRETFSCYTINLKLLKDVEYWDTSLAIDDTTFYWRPYFFLKGDWECEVFFIPLNADATYDDNYLENHKLQYKQYLRWGWGVISVPLALKLLFKNNTGVPLIERMFKIYHLFEVFVFWKVFAFLLVFGVPVVLFLNRDLQDFVIVYTVPTTISNLLTLASIFLIPTTIFKVLLIPPRPKSMSILKYFLLILIEIPLNILTLFTFSFLPFIEATTRMMLGQPHASVIKWSDKKLATK